jgi:hypothetical protein
MTVTRGAGSAGNAWTLPATVRAFVAPEIDAHEDRCLDELRADQRDRPGVDRHARCRVLALVAAHA